MNVPCNVVIDDNLTQCPPGSIRYDFDAVGGPVGFHFRCPCGQCEHVGRVSFLEGGWQYNNNRLLPTVRPSVFLNPSENHWHGFLTDGVWTPV